MPGNVFAVEFSSGFLVTVLGFSDGSALSVTVVVTVQAIDAV